MMQHKFRAIQKVPEVGDLIRNRDTGNYINIVISISETQEDSTGKFFYIRSVRYGKTNGVDFELLHGKRSRAFKYYLPPGFNKWDVVVENVLVKRQVTVSVFEPLDNALLRNFIVSSLKDVDTTWKAKEVDKWASPF
jgi:hypothetical protein